MVHVAMCLLYGFEEPYDSCSVEWENRFSTEYLETLAEGQEINFKLTITQEWIYSRILWYILQYFKKWFILKYEGMIPAIGTKLWE